MVRRGYFENRGRDKTAFPTTTSRALHRKIGRSLIFKRASRNPFTYVNLD